MFELLIDIQRAIRGSLSDYIEAFADSGDWGFLFAMLPLGVVALKRLAGRPQDEQDHCGRQERQPAVCELTMHEHGARTWCQVLPLTLSDVKDVAELVLEATEG